MWVRGAQELSINESVQTGSATHFQQAKDELDAASRELTSAQTRFIHAQRRYHEASRAYVNKWLSN